MIQRVIGALSWWLILGPSIVLLFWVLISTLGPPINRRSRMFRVPANPDNPTFNNTIKIGLWRWLTSSAADRKEWARRRNVAAKTAQANQLNRQQIRGDERSAELRKQRAELHAREDQIKAEIKDQWRKRPR